MVWLRSGAYAAVEGRDVAKAVASHSKDPMQVTKAIGGTNFSQVNDALL
jgi:hypothetical protein